MATVTRGIATAHVTGNWCHVYPLHLSSVWINPTQHFTGVPTEAWTWGGAFRPLEHFLVERRGKVLDMEQVQMFQQAINAVRTSIEMAPALDAALDVVLAETLDVDLT